MKKFSNPHDLVTNIESSKIIDEITLKKRPKEDILQIFDPDLFEASLSAWNLDETKECKKIIAIYKKKYPKWPKNCPYPYLFHDSHNFKDYSWIKELTWFKSCLETGNYKKLINDWMINGEEWVPLQVCYEHLQKHLDFHFYYVQYRNETSISLKEYLEHNKTKPSFEDFFSWLLRIFSDSDWNSEDASVEQLIENVNNIICFCDKVGIEVYPVTNYNLWSIKEAELDDWSQGTPSQEKEKAKLIKNFIRIFKDWPEPRLSYTRLLKQ